jgi:large subunit ribosomal protein L6
MSRIGKLPITISDTVNVETEGKLIKVKGPKGELERKLPRPLGVETKDGNIQIVIEKNAVGAKALHGTYRSIVANMVKGVTDGWTKTLELIGTGYRAEAVNNTLTLNVGYSHPVIFESPEGISFKVEKNKITIEGIDKELVGSIAEKIRKVRPPEPYKGKGIKYEDEIVRRKAGKAAKAAG